MKLKQKFVMSILIKVSFYMKISFRLNVVVKMVIGD